MQNDVQQHFQNIQQIIRHGKAGAWQAVNAHVEFLNLKEPHSEFELKKALVANMRQFLLELGRDFMFLEEEIHLQVGMNDYFVDLVFFHREKTAPTHGHIMMPTKKK